MIHRRRNPRFASMCRNYAIPLAYIYWVISRTIRGSDIESQNMPAAGYIYCYICEDIMMPTLFVFVREAIYVQIGDLPYLVQII
jgi:hypothetical protein